MLYLEVLVRERACPVDARAACAITIEEVAALEHKIFDDAMEFAAFVSNGLAQMVFGLACTEVPKVLRRSWRYVLE